MRSSQIGFTTSQSKKKKKKKNMNRCLLQFITKRTVWGIFPFDFIKTIIECNCFMKKLKIKSSVECKRVASAFL